MKYIVKKTKKKSGDLWLASVLKWNYKHFRSEKTNDLCPQNKRNVQQIVNKNVTAFKDITLARKNYHSMVNSLKLGSFADFLLNFREIFKLYLYRIRKINISKHFSFVSSSLSSRLFTKQQLQNINILFIWVLVTFQYKLAHNKFISLYV